MGKFFIARPVMAIVIALLTVLIGGVAMTRLPVAQYPEIVPPEVRVSATYTGADALTMEQSVATPLEQQINGVDNMIYIRSINSSDGTTSLRVSFSVGTNVDMDTVLVQNRSTEATPLLPADVRALGISIRKATTNPLLLFSIYSPNGSYDQQFLANYATINVIDAIKRVPGVGDAAVLGSSDYAMRIWVRPDQLQTLGLTFGELRAAILKQSTVNPAGQVGGEPAPPGQEFTYTIRAQGRLVTAEEFGNVVVRENPDGSIVRLKDVSQIELGTQTYTSRGRMDGKPAGIIAVYQTPGSNALTVAEGVKGAMSDLSQRFPSDVAYATSLDTTLAVQAGIHDIVETLFEALVLVILVVFIFLQSWRATLIPLLTVPVSLIGAFALFPLLGFSVNTLSLFGLVLAIGLVVDDAIVVVEAVEYHIEHGMPAREATQKAMEEVSAPVVAIALVLSAVFIPVAVVPGITGELYQQFALTIAISVMISAFNALSLSPALCAMLLKPRTGKKGVLTRAFGAFNRGFDRMGDRYGRTVAGLARKLVRGILILVIFTVVAGFFAVRLPKGFITEEDQGYFFVNVQLPDAASLQRTDEVCKKIEGILAKQPGILHFNTVAGFSLLSSTTAPYTAFYFVSLKPWEERKGSAMTAEGIVRTLNRAFSQLPEAVTIAFAPPAIPGVGTGSGFSFMLQDRSGTNTPQQLAQQAARFVEAAQKRPELANVNNTFRASVPQIFARVDREKVLKEGVDIGDVYATLQAFMGGAYINDFNRFGRQWRVYLAAAPEYRVKADEIGRFWVRSGNGEMVPLSSFVATESTIGPQFTVRFNLYRAVEITGSAAPGYSSGQAMAALEDVAKEVLPSDYGHAWNALSYQQATAPSAVGIFALALIFVFLILAALYESWSLPFSILLGAPIGVCGALLGLWARRMELNVYAQIGLIMLIGLASKNAVLIVEFAKSAREGGMSFVDAAVRGARQRLRPILMTSFAFVLGCVPLLIATGSGAIARRVLGSVVVFGMLAATTVGIFITPVLFVLFERILERFKRKKRPSESGAPHGPLSPVPGGGLVAPADEGPGGNEGGE